ncbi:MAG: hypothetical protein MUE97_08115 [Phycisphaerales bacterium]|nr:hypothetical protein [Phycisphaerales bacterium]
MWNLAPGPCPECGAPFKPSDFNLTANACRFICPTAGCGQDYYGTDGLGHLVPAEFVCVRCGQQVGMDQMRLLPTVGVDESLTQQDRNPWAERKQRGVVRAFVATWGKGFGSPGGLGQAVANEPSNAGAAAWFALVLCMLYGSVGFGWLLAIIAFSTPLRMGVQAGGSQVVMGLLKGAMAFVVPGLVLFAGLTLWGLASGVLVNHWLLTRGGKRISMGRMLESVYYTSPTLVLFAVPCAYGLLGLVGLIWTGLAASFMIEGYREGDGRRGGMWGRNEGGMMDPRVSPMDVVRSQRGVGWVILAMVVPPAVCVTGVASWIVWRWY